MSIFWVWLWLTYFQDLLHSSLHALCWQVPCNWCFTDTFCIYTYFIQVTNTGCSRIQLFNQVTLMIWLPLGMEFPLTVLILPFGGKMLGKPTSSKATGQYVCDTLRTHISSHLVICKVRSTLNDWYCYK